MNSFLDESDDPWNHFVTALATDTSVPERARPHLARWVSQWRREGGDESAEATTAFFEELGRSPTLYNIGKNPEGRRGFGRSAAKPAG